LGCPLVRRQKLEAANAIERPNTVWISRQSGDDDDDLGDDLGDWPFDRLQDLVQRLLPGHVGAGGPDRPYHQIGGGNHGRRGTIHRSREITKLMIGPLLV
jgi:hypothetical protein